MKTPLVPYFTKNDTSIFKGIGILMIVLHNYLHFEKGFFLENEAVFNPNNVKSFMQLMMPLKWYESFSAVFAFLGHYGVQLFIFFSAYGLAIQMSKNDKKFNYIQYLLPRLKKLYFLLFFGIGVFLVINYFSFGRFYGVERTLKEAFMLITSAANFRNSTLYSSFSGPFWFFGLMVQVYLFFPLLYRIVKKLNIYVLLGIVFLLISILYYFDRKYDFSLFGNIIGHLPEIILGIYFAQKGITKPNVIVFLGSIFVFVISQFYGTVFPFSFLAITIILLYLITLVKPYVNDYFTRTLMYVGEISMILFVVNGPMRHLSFFRLENSELRAERVFLYLLILFFITYFLHRLYVYLTIRFRI